VLLLLLLLLLLAVLLSCSSYEDCRLLGSVLLLSTRSALPRCCFGSVLQLLLLLPVVEHAD
jgi:hypothetical protein